MGSPQHTSFNDCRHVNFDVWPSCGHYHLHPMKPRRATVDYWRSAIRSSNCNRLFVAIIADVSPLLRSLIRRQRPDQRRCEEDRLTRPLLSKYIVFCRQAFGWAQYRPSRTVMLGSHLLKGLRRSHGRTIDICDDRND
jgi:hypothetical protein